MRINKNNEPIYLEIILSAYLYHRHELKDFFISQIKVIQNNYFVKEINMQFNFLNEIKVLEKYIIKKTEIEKSRFESDDIMCLVEYEYEGVMYFLLLEDFYVIKKELLNALFQYQVINKKQEKWFYVLLEYAMGEFLNYNSLGLNASKIAQMIKDKYELSDNIPSNYISEIRNNLGNSKNYLRDKNKVVEVYNYCISNKDTIKITDEFLKIYSDFSD
ncbi:hypothetical protein [Chryseobacterium sp. OV279]|uniref:hypothetical protein n=1 Tax=Chryseobacterium sp. OV279 TaxID=1500285 RepID=UPI00091543E4|nr:hypothetical protein [Chryseobacterium sp. OV279]SHE49331.1 hypothetical protein SAMN02787100_0187 [Chryseobacterium sp. OV279]